AISLCAVVSLVRRGELEIYTSLPSLRKHSQELRSGQNQATMASSGLRRCNSVEFLPPHIAAVVRLTNEFLELYARDHPQLQQCIQKLHNIIKTFEKDFRGSTEGSKDAGVMGIIGGSAVLTG
ncbi:hypothetical protein PO909_024853, partial [Leuciscus waleckii]